MYLVVARARAWPLSDAITPRNHLFQSFVHVSTAYANCHLENIDETFYSYPFSGDDLSEMLEKIDDKTAEQITPRLLGAWPNTYSLTKALGEGIINDARHTLPLGIFRPAIITSAWKEPIRGWIDNYYGPTGICAAAMMGVLKSLHCDGDIIANIVPVDMCTNALIAIGWDVAENHRRGASPIYNYVSTCDNPLSWIEYAKINILYGEKYPLSNTVSPESSFECHRSLWLHKFYITLLHFIPALFLDLFSVVFTSRPPKMLKIHTKILKLTEVITYFSTREWGYRNGNVRALVGRMSGEDREMFCLDLKKLDWMDYFRNYVLGIRRFLFKEGDANLQQARSRVRR